MKTLVVLLCITCAPITQNMGARECSNMVTMALIEYPSLMIRCEDIKQKPKPVAAVPLPRPRPVALPFFGR